MNDGNPAAADFHGRPASAAWHLVASDMQTIFGTGARPPRVPRTPTAIAASPATTSAQAGIRRIALPLVLVTCLAGAAAGLVVVAPLRQPHAAGVTRPPAASRHAAAPAGSSVPVAMAVSSAPAPQVLPSTPESDAAALPAGAIVARNRPETMRPAPVPNSARRGEDEGVTCTDADDAGYAACSREDVLAADRDLRQAYDRAIDAGVDRGRLVSIRNRWARLRADESDRPDELLAGYADLADRLDRAADDAGDLR